MSRKPYKREFIKDLMDMNNIYHAIVDTNPHTVIDFIKKYDKESSCWYTFETETKLLSFPTYIEFLKYYNSEISSLSHKHSCSILREILYSILTDNKKNDITTRYVKKAMDIDDDDITTANWGKTQFSIWAEHLTKCLYRDIYSLEFDFGPGGKYYFYAFLFDYKNRVTRRYIITTDDLCIIDHLTNINPDNIENISECLADGCDDLLKQYDLYHSDSE
jgi:hypothetical protein